MNSWLRAKNVLNVKVFTLDETVTDFSICKRESYVKKIATWSMLVSSPDNERNSPTHGLVGQKFDFNLIQKDYMNRPNVYATTDISNTMTGNCKRSKNPRERSSLPTNVDPKNLKNNLNDVLKSKTNNQPKQEELLYVSSETHYKLQKTNDKNKTRISTLVHKGNEIAGPCYEETNPSNAMINQQNKSQSSTHPNGLTDTVTLPNCAPHTKQSGTYSRMQNTLFGIHNKEKSQQDTRRDDTQLHSTYDKALPKGTMNETNFLRKSSNKPKNLMMPLQKVSSDSVQITIEKFHNSKEENECHATQESTQEFSRTVSSVSLHLEEVPMKQDMSKEGITEKECCAKNSRRKGNDICDGFSSHFSNSQYPIREKKGNGSCFASEEISQFPEKANTKLHEKRSDSIVSFSNERSKCLFYETQLEIYFGFIGFQIMLVIISFIFSNEAGGLLFLFGFFSALYSHIDRRASAYLLTACILCISATVLCISVSTGIRGFLPYKEDPTLNIIAIGCLPLCFLFLLHNISLAWQHCQFKRKEKKNEAEF